MSVLAFASCDEGGAKADRVKSNPLVGQDTIWCDESLEKLIAEELDVFRRTYKYAELEVMYAPEMVIKRKFYNDEINAMIVSHSIDSADIAIFKERKLFPSHYKFATSAIAFVGHVDRKHLQYSYDEMLGLLAEGNQVFAIENRESGIAYELTQRLGGRQLSGSVFALSSKEKIVEWLKDNPTGIGIIDWSNISDEDDPESIELLNKLSLIEIAGVTPETRDEYYPPSQSYLNGWYPFTRELFIIRRLNKKDVTLGFSVFVCDIPGQKIVLKAGLLPEYQIERWVEFKETPNIKVVE